MATKEQLKAKYSRLREDPSQLQMFGDEIIDLVKDNEVDISSVDERVDAAFVVFAPSYSNLATYTVGKLCIYDDKLYKCSIAVTIPEEFDTTKWEVVDIENLLALKVDLVNGKVPSSQLPSYVSNIVEVEDYNALPATGTSDTIYVTLDDGHQFRWGGTTYVDITQANNYFSVSVSDISTMGDLRTYINGLNTEGLHCLFDFSSYITNAFVCTVLMFTQNSVNYCLIFDVINGRTFINYAGYQDSDTVQNYVDRNEDDLIRSIKITDNTLTIGDISTMITNINNLHHHILFDVSALNAGAYLCSIFIDSGNVKIFDIVTQKNVTVAYTASDLLTTLLSKLEGIVANSIHALTTAPTAANTAGDIKFVVLDDEPTDYYDGYYYIIVEPVV